MCKSMFESQADKTYGYYNFDPVQFSIIKKEGEVILRYQYYAEGEITREIKASSINIDDLNTAKIKISNSDFPVIINITGANPSIHFLLKHLDKRGNIRGYMVCKLFGFLPTSWSPVNIKQASIIRFIGDLKKISGTDHSF